MMRHLRFARRVLRDFVRNRGLLLAGGVGYNILLSIVPLFAVLAVILSHFVSEERLLEVIGVQAELLAPGQADLVADAVRALTEDGEVIGWVSFGVMLFFSSFAFRMLDDAIAIIFQRDRDAGIRKRRAWVTLLLPYVYVLVLGVALLVLTGFVALLDGLEGRELTVLGVDVPTSAAAVLGLWASGFLGMTLLFASIYKVLPVVRIAPVRALVGGFVAAGLWELTRWGLGWWFSNLSLVNAVYGSLGTVVIVLLCLEAAAVILLLGAQVIAELERSARAGLAWHEEAEG